MGLLHNVDLIELYDTLPSRGRGAILQPWWAESLDVELEWTRRLANCPGCTFSEHQIESHTISLLYSKSRWPNKLRNPSLTATCLKCRHEVQKPLAGLIDWNKIFLA